MYMKNKVKIPNSGQGISRKKSKGRYISITHMAEVTTIKKYTVPRNTMIGKVDDEHPDMMYPNEYFREYFPDVKIPELISTFPTS